MSEIRLLAIGEIEARLLASLVSPLASALDARCSRLPAALDPTFAFHPERRQYCSTELLQRMETLADGDGLVLGVTGVDLFIPILTFVFGEAQVGGPCAVVSTHRLRQEFYGLEPDAALVEERLVKEALHEVGHALRLAHCDDYRCAMAPSHAVEWIDVKERAFFCLDCRARLADRRTQLA